MLGQNADVTRRWIGAVKTLALHGHQSQEQVTALVALAMEYVAELDIHSAATTLLLERLSGTEKLVRILRYTCRLSIIPALSTYSVRINHENRSTTPSTTETRNRSSSPPRH